MAMSWMTPSLHGDVVGDINADAESGGIADMNANAEASGVAMASVHDKTMAFKCNNMLCEGGCGYALEECEAGWRGAYPSEDDSQDDVDTSIQDDKDKKRLRDILHELIKKHTDMRKRRKPQLLHPSQAKRPKPAHVPIFAAFTKAHYWQDVTGHPHHRMKALAELFQSERLVGAA